MNWFVFNLNKHLRQGSFVRVVFAIVQRSQKDFVLKKKEFFRFLAEKNSDQLIQFCQTSKLYRRFVNLELLSKVREL